MKSSFLSARWILIGSIVLIVVIAVIVRFVPGAPPTPSSTSLSSSVSGLPAFTSAKFNSGDVLAGLGPEWSVVRQNQIAGKDAKDLNGTAATRETIVHLIGKNTEMLITEYVINDVGVLDQALGTPNITKHTIAGRDGYIVPVPSLTGGSAFFMAGTSTALMLEYGEDPFGNWMPWPDTVPNAIKSYIASVRLK